MWTKSQRVRLCCLVTEYTRCKNLKCHTPLCMEHAIEASVTWSSEDAHPDYLCKRCAFHRQIYRALPAVLLVCLIIYAIFIPK